tara:strand:+ start:249 stop:758 length:510 start_codon:yes stop_codon:yes gene_type:complete
MPNLPISGLPASDALTGAELFADVQGGVTKYTTLDAVTNYVTGSIDTYNQSNTNNSYLVPVDITVQDGVDQYLTGSAYANTAMIHLDWTGTNGTMDLFLPDATAAVNVNRSIRFISDSTFATNTRAELTPLIGQTLDGGGGSYTINKAYEGTMVWSDGVEWYRIQTKAG